MDYLVRDASREEAKELAILVNHAGTGPNNTGLDIVGWTLAAKDGEGPFDYGGRIVADEDGIYSYRNMRVVEANGKVAAMALCFEAFKRTAEDMNQIAEEFRIFKEMTNTIPGEFYLDSLAADPDFRGQGFGRIMLEDSIEKARTQGYRCVYLIAFANNVAGVALYEKNGFYAVSTKTASDHPDMPYSGDVVLYKKDI